jgi:hypothetical protein
MIHQEAVTKFHDQRVNLVEDLAHGQGQRVGAVDRIA